MHRFNIWAGLLLESSSSWPCTRRGCAGILKRAPDATSSPPDCFQKHISSLNLAQEVKMVMERKSSVMDRQGEGGCRHSKISYQSPIAVDFVCLLGDKIKFWGMDIWIDEVLRTPPTGMVNSWCHDFTIKYGVLEAAVIGKCVFDLKNKIKLLLKWHHPPVHLDWNGLYWVAVHFNGNDDLGSSRYFPDERYDSVEILIFTWDWINNLPFNQVGQRDNKIALQGSKPALVITIAIVVANSFN